MEDRHVLVPASWPFPLPGRSRFLAVPASWPFPLPGRSRFLAVLSLLSLFALFLPQPTQAQGHGGGYPGGGSWQSGPNDPVYSCTASATGGSVSPPNPNTATVFGPNGSTLTITGTATITYTWVPAAGTTTLPPPCLIAHETLTTTTGAMGGGAPGATVVKERWSARDGSSGTVVLSSGTMTASYTVNATNGDKSGVATLTYAAAVSVPPLQAHSTVDANGTSGANGHYTNPWDPTHPRFFSGTNCSVSGTAMAYSAKPGGGSYPAGGTYVMQATLSIGGTAVKFYDDSTAYGPFPLGTTIGTNQSSAPLSAVFDSTYFADGNPIPAQMTVTDSGGLTYTVPLSGPACNNLVAIANLTNSLIDYQTGENLALLALNATNGIAKGQRSQLNYQPCPGVVVQSTPSNIGIGTSPIGTHHRDVLINDIATSGYTAFFADTHADPGLLGDCYSLSDGNLAAYLTDADIRGAITTRTAALSAPYLFVYLHGCDSGSNTSLADDFGVTSSTDTGFAGFGAPIYVSQNNVNFTVDAWQYLMQGEKLLDALSAADSDYPVQAFINSNTPPNKSGVTIPVPRGDNNMTLYGKVYNWTSGPTWYR